MRDGGRWRRGWDENGLLGSRYYVDHPLVPLAQTAAYVNFDMVGRLRDNWRWLRARHRPCRLILQAQSCPETGQRAAC